MENVEDFNSAVLFFLPEPFYMQVVLLMQGTWITAA